MKASEKKELFERLFQGFNLKKNDVIRFKRGRTLWRVSWETDKGVLIESLGLRDSGRYLYPRDHNRVEKVTGLPLVRWLLRNRPEMLRRLVPSTKLRIRWVRKLVPKGDLNDIDYSKVR